MEHLIILLRICSGDIVHITLVTKLWEEAVIRALNGAKCVDLALHMLIIIVDLDHYDYYITV